MIDQSLVSLASVAVGGLIAIVTQSRMLQNQRKLEEQRFNNERELEKERREHDAADFRVRLKLSIKQLFVASTMNPKAPVFFAELDKSTR